MTSNRALTSFNSKLPLVIAIDAFPYGISAVLFHVILDNTEKSRGFVSRTLINAEKMYIARCGYRSFFNYFWSK